MTSSNMQKVKDLVKKVNIADREDSSVIVDEFAKKIIDKVFGELAVIFPAWKNAWPTQKELAMAKLQWTKAFVENNICTMEQIRYGFAKARKAETDFLPSCGKFVSWCTPSADDLGYPGEQQAMKECIKHRNNQKMFKPLKMHVRPLIIELCKRVDWFLMETASTKVELDKSNKHFSDVYLELVQNFVEPEFKPDVMLPTKETVDRGMSEQQKEDARKRGLELLAETRKKLKRNKSK